jgi:hypothetical protein
MRRITRTLAVGLFAASAAIAISVGATGAAWADDTPPTSMELLDECNKSTDLCVFHPNGGPELYVGDAHQVGDTLFNCGPGQATKEVTWIDATGETDSVSLSFIVATEGGGADGWVGAFKTEFEITYGHKWGTTESTNRTTPVAVEAGDKGWLVRATPMQRISGTYELHFGSRFHGHYIWYVPFTVEGAAPEGGSVDVVAQHTAPMTDDEKRQCA